MTIDYRHHDSVLVRAHAMINLLERTFPINEDEQKEAFFNGGRAEPRFVYKPLDFDVAALVEELASLECEDDELGALYAGVRDDMLLQVEIISSLGNREIVQPASQKLFEAISPALLAAAEERLASGLYNDGLEMERTICSAETILMFEESLKKMGLVDWHVEPTHRFIISVISSRKTVTVSRDRMFSREEITRLLVHEIGVHVVRAANGGCQPYRIFTVGFPQYGATEEGTAVFTEELAGVIDNEAQFRYAARVVAAQTLYDGLTFNDTFDAMKSAGYGDEGAWQIALRTHRGGGMAKDHIYLKGYLEVSERFKHSMNDFKYLFMGKVNLASLDVLKRLVEQGTLTGPRHIPEYLVDYL